LSAKAARSVVAARSASAVDLLSGQAVDWIVPLAEPYLRGYVPALEGDASLSGYRFIAPPFARPLKNRGGSARAGSRAAAAGFFVGYLHDPSGFEFLRPQAPECLVFCWIEPASGALHRRLVQAPESLLRGTAEYIRWLTHRLPRFQFCPEERVVLARHASLGDWPPEKWGHLSRNFFIETMCWLVRSALVRRLAAEGESVKSGVL
jgi:hypothetical protein